MSDSVKTGLLAAYSKLLRPLIRILLRHGVTYAEFSEVVKTGFVTIAAQEFRVPGKKMSKARIAIVTGLTSAMSDMEDNMRLRRVARQADGGPGSRSEARGAAS